MTDTLLSLAGIFLRLSLLAFGGGNTVLPEMQREVVEVHRWMTATDFASLFALAQAAPGPNLMVATLIGFRVAGLPGALVATVGIIGPSSVLTMATVSVWHRFRDKPWRRVVQAGITPVTVGFVAATAAVIVKAADVNLALTAVTAVVAGLSLATRLHPLWLLGGGGLLGVLGAG
ncbi:chromate transporter [Rhodovastum sp. RN2-1]|uniref:Chromate transporter n=1 Tax=Limobrevibacterium gyesilva TaxID=2991712 RepID=A0AA41YLQ4_9PROT|nr:chromate transporter [Limobrevibacterium gyesilva]